MGHCSCRLPWSESTCSIPQDNTYALSGDQNAKSFRLALNKIPLAVKTTNAGASDPPNPKTGQLWVDESSAELKIHNATNQAWYTLGSTEKDNIVPKQGTVPAYVFDNEFTGILQQFWTDTDTWTLTANGTPPP